MDEGQKNSSIVPSKLELLLQMAQKQTESFELFQRAELSKIRGDLDSASTWYDKLIVVSYEHLTIALLHNQHHENPVEIHSIVQPLINALFVHADIIEAKGDPDAAEKLRNDALIFSKKHLGAHGDAETERARAASLISHGRFNEALVTLANTRDFFHIEGDVLRLARVTLDMVDILHWLGDTTRALSELNQVSEIIRPQITEKIPTQRDIVTSLFKSIGSIMSGLEDATKAVKTVELYRIYTEINYYRGLINKSSGNFEEAAKFFQLVLPEYKNLGAGAAIEYQLASCHVSEGDNQETLYYTNRLEPEFRKGDILRPKLAGLLKIKAEALFNMGEAEEALSLLNEGIKDLEAYYDPDLLWKLQWLKGRTLNSTGEREKALDTYSHAIETVNDLRKAPLGYRLDSTYLMDKIPLFEDAINLATGMGRAGECVGFMELIKSRILTAALSTTDPGHHESSKDIGIKRKIEDLTRDLDSLEYQGYQEGWTDEIRGKRKAILDERTTLVERVRFSDPRWKNLTEPVPFDLNKITKILSEKNYAAISLFYQQDRITATLIKDGKIKATQFIVPPEIRSKLEKYQYNLQMEVKNQFKPFYDISELGVGAKHLVPTELLLEALKAKQLIVIPHGPLHLIPWAGLIFNGKRLFEYCPVGLLPNLSCIISIEARLSKTPRIALIGSPDYSGLSNIIPLTYTEKEIEEIKQLYSDQEKIIGKVITREDSTEKGFWELANHKDASGGILHINCHGTIEPYEPMNSGLLMEDSKVDASEIARTSLKYDEVILSACSTGWRPVKVRDIELSGDDILGLPGAFLEAGVKSVLVSIPIADDRASCRFMTLYHQNRIDGKSPLTSLQETQKTMLSDSEYEPFTWIGFTVYGYQ